MSKSNMVCGLAWYSPEQYGLLRALATDPDAIGKTYDEWLAGVLKMAQDLRKRGLVVRRVDVEVKELAEWCQQRGMPLDGKARATYASEKLRAFDEGS